MSISLQRLRYFHAIAATGSLSAAARKLGIAQPALSYHLTELEADLGTTLLVRSTRGVKLTDTGGLLLRRADEVLKQVEDLEREVRGVADVPNGEVTVALAVTMARQLVPEIFAIMDSRYPMVRVKIMDVGSRQALELMKSGQAEVGLVPNAAEIHNCEAEAVYAERLFLVALRRGRRRQVAPIRFDEIGDRPLVLPPPNFDLRRRIEEAAIDVGCRLNVRYEQESQEMVRTIVLAGIATTITQAAQFNPDTERPLLDIRPIVAPEITRTHAIVRLRDRAATKAMVAISLAVREAIEHLAARGILPGRYIANLGEVAPPAVPRGAGRSAAPQGATVRVRR